MDEKEEYLKDQAASRAELNEAINDYAMDYAATCHDMADKFDTENFKRSEIKVNSLLDVLYARLYLAECPF